MSGFGAPDSSCSEVGRVRAGSWFSDCQEVSAAARCSQSGLAAPVRCVKPVLGSEGGRGGSVGALYKAVGVWCAVAAEERVAVQWRARAGWRCHCCHSRLAHRGRPGQQSQPASNAPQYRQYTVAVHQD